MPRKMDTKDGHVMLKKVAAPVPKIRMYYNFLKRYSYVKAALKIEFSQNLSIVCYLYLDPGLYSYCSLWTMFGTCMNSFIDCINHVHNTMCLIFTRSAAFHCIISQISLRTSRHLFKYLISKNFNEDLSLAL